MSGFFPIDRGIFTSSVWLSGSPEERLLWFWLLGNKDDDGVVRHRELAIADGAKLPRAAVEAALAKFAEPDPDSRTRDNDGRRIERTEDGFVRVLNHERYYSRDYSTPRWRRWKARQRANALASLENVGSTKDTDKDKDKDTERIAAAAPRAVAPSRLKRPSRTTTTATVAEKAAAVEVLAPGASPSWSREACDDWIGRFGGTAPGGRIGKALAPLVKAHGWPAVREAWRSYLAQAEAEFASAQRFAQTFGRWNGTAAPAKAKATATDRMFAEAAAFVAAGGSE